MKFTKTALSLTLLVISSMTWSNTTSTEAMVLPDIDQFNYTEVDMKIAQAQVEMMEQNYEKAIKLLQPLAEKGNLQAQLELGKVFVEKASAAEQNDSPNGDWAEHQDYKQAVAWFSKAAQQNSREAMVLLSSHYQNGSGIEPSSVEAEKWLKRAADETNAADKDNDMLAEAEFQLGILYSYQEGKEAESWDWNLKAVQRDHTWAMINQAAHYMQQQQYVEALPLLQRLITDAKHQTIAADADVYQSLGILYQNGDVVAQDVDQAIEYYQQAIAIYENQDEQNNPAVAYTQLGNFYLNGTGVKKDLKQAEGLFEKADESTEALVGLGKIYLQQKKPQKAIEVLEIVTLFEPEANLLLGEIYEKGNGVKADKKKAVEYYQKVSTAVKGQKNITKSLTQLPDEATLEKAQQAIDERFQESMEKAKAALKRLEQ